MIPLSVPVIAGNEWTYVKECLDTGWVSSAGAYVGRFEKAVADFAGARYGVACMNGTAGLHLCLRVMGVNDDHHVIAPNITFVATLNAIHYTGAKPILVDVDPETWQMDLDLLERFFEQQTTQNENGQIIFNDTGKVIKAIMPVHVLGNVCDVERLQELSQKYEIEIVEDSTESLGSYYNNKHTGTFGRFGVFSFNGNKIITTGGGGVIVTNNEEDAKYLKHLTTQAKTSPQEYVHDAVGYNYRLVNVLAAMGVAQMELLPEFIARKKMIDKAYREALSGVGDIEFQSVSEKVDPNCWLFTLQTSRMRELLQYLNDNGVQSRPFWMPMNQLQMYSDEVYISDHNHSDQIYRTCLSIPSSSDLTDSQLNEVINQIKNFFEHAN